MNRLILSAVCLAIGTSFVNAKATNLYWGDTHLHTNLSMDAGAFGNRIGMDEAYKFARGDEVTSSTGLKTKLSRPLDFLVIADHSDGMGLFPAIVNKEEWIMNAPEGPRWRKMYEEGKNSEMAIDIIRNFSQGNFSFKTNDPKIMTPVWERIVAAAEKYNDPGTFTAFIGYEWTSLIKGNNLHRCVIYRDNGDKTRGHLPYTLADSPDPEDLWNNLAMYEKNTGGQVLAIAHNGNLSNGMMFMEETISGDKFDKDYVDRRIRWEPLYEATQIKGDGETHPFLSPNDEFADYENWDFGNLDLSAYKTNDMLQYEYTRSALKLGLKIKNELGTNPYKFGLIGSTDSHTSLATADESNFFGKASNVEPSAERFDHIFVPSEKVNIMTWQTVASGYVAVWAQENTRTSIWDAMKRKEVYATTGSRLKVRVFGGWDYAAADLDRPDFAKNGYKKGVPMGGDLTTPEAGKAPLFLIKALRDADGANIDRVQIIKGWLDADGNKQERIYDLAVSDNRTIAANGRCKTPVGTTVNIKEATYDNSIGAPTLEAYWVDPEFDANLKAFYYVRVIEIPTPRWTAYDAAYYGIDMPEGTVMTLQDRAYTSPIWYTPKN